LSCCLALKWLGLVKLLANGHLAQFKSIDI
jgi:hypothetical protein